MAECRNGGGRHDQRGEREWERARRRQELGGERQRPRASKRNRAQQRKTRLLRAGRKVAHNKGCSDKHLTAIEMLLRGASDAEVGEHLGVDRGTVYRWRTTNVA